jgi:hypothetical protein
MTQKTRPVIAKQLAGAALAVVMFARSAETFALDNKPSEDPRTSPTVRPLSCGHSSLEDCLKDDPFDLFSPDTERTLMDSFTTVDDTLQSSVNYVDTFFVDDRLDYETRGNRLRFRFETKLEQREGADVNPRFRLNVRLPRTSNRLNLVVGSFDTDSPNAEQPIMTNNDNDLFAGLRTFLGGQSYLKHLHGLVDLGVRSDGASPAFIARTRVRYAESWGNWIGRITPLVYFRSDEKLGSGLGIDIDRVFDETVLARNRLELNYSDQSIQDKEDVQFIEDLSLYVLPEDKRGYRFSFSMQGQSRGATTVTDYEALSLVRQALFRNLLYAELGPGLAWREQHDYTTSLLVRFNLEFIFGGQGNRGIDFMRKANRDFLDSGATDAVQWN